MAEADDPIAQALRRAGWRQGDLIPPVDAAAVLNESVDLCQVTPSDQLWLIVLTQDCDILRECRTEPHVEMIAAKATDRHNRQLETGESARRLQIPARTASGASWLECSIHDRFRVPKEAVAGLTRQTTTALDHEARRNLRKWVARRYTRQPFPDAFERRLNPRHGPVRELFKQAAAKLISTIYIETSEDELPEGTPYQLKVLLVARDRDLIDQDLAPVIDDFEESFRTTFEAQPGIVFTVDPRGNPDLQVIGEDRLTLGQIRRYKRFDADYRSSDEDAVSPPDGVDEA